MTPQDKIDEHAKRKAWNESAVERLGLRLIKTKDQVISLHLMQGEYTLHSEWNSHHGQEIHYIMHKNLEVFLIAYINHLDDYLPLGAGSRLLRDREFAGQVKLRPV